MGLVINDFADENNMIAAFILEMCFAAEEGRIFGEEWKTLVA